MAKKQKNKIDWLNHLIGLVAVLFGVLIAFWLNNWSEENKAEATMKVALENIRSEIDKNSASLDTIIQSNTRLHTFLSVYLQSVDDGMSVLVNETEWSVLTEKYPQYLNEGKSGVQIDMDLFQLSDVAWSASHRTDVFSYMDYDLAFTLEKAYALQEKLNEFDSSLIEDLKAIDNTKTSFTRLHRTLGFALGLAANLRQKNYVELSIAIDNYLKK